jgi:hypothetical protein
VHPASSYAWNLDTWHSPSPACNPTIVKGRKKTPAKLFLCGLMLLFQHVHSKKRLGLCRRNLLSVLNSATRGLVAGALPSPRRTDEGDRVAGMRLCPNSTISTATKTASPDWFELQLPTTRNETKQLRVKNEKIRMKYPTVASIPNLTAQVCKREQLWSGRSDGEGEGPRTWRRTPSSSPTPTAQIAGGRPLLRRTRRPQDPTSPSLANELRRSSSAPSALPEVLPSRLLPFLTFISYRCLFNK